MGAALANQEESQNKHSLHPLHASGLMDLIGNFYLLCSSLLQTQIEQNVTNNEAHYSPTDEV